MMIDILTKEDLIQFKQDLLTEINNLIRPTNVVENKEWLRSSEVRALLKISSGTLQTLRINKTLQYSKVGDTMYYRLSDITKLLEGGKNA